MTANATIDRFQKRTAQARPADLISVEDMEAICPVCAESMKKKGMKAISAYSIIQAMLDGDKRQGLTAQGAGPGNLPALIKHWKGREHPFTECKRWTEEHKGATRHRGYGRAWTQDYLSQRKPQ